MPTLRPFERRRKTRGRVIFFSILGVIVLFAALQAVTACAKTDDGDMEIRESATGYLSEKYFSARAIFDRGDYIEALQEYGDEIRRTVQNGRRHWVDSICYHARVGECHYQMGEIGNAMACFDIALQDCLDNDEWPGWLHFDTAPNVRYKAKSLPPWGDRSLSSGEMAIIPDRVMMDYMLPDVDTNDSPRGYLPAPDAESQPIDPTEVAVCMALVLGRRAEILGPLGRYDELNEKLLHQLRKRPFPQEHWSNAWGDILLALALTTAGNDLEAKPLLEQSLQLDKKADHPLTGFAQLELGKIAIRATDYPAANRWFVAASLSGWHYEDAFVMGEAFRNIAMTRRMISADPNANVMPKALEWAEKERLRGMQILLNTLAAEDAVARREFAAAETKLKRARTVAEKHDVERGRLAGNWDYLGAITSYHADNTTVGDKTLEAALGRIRRASPWCYQLAQLEKLFDSGKISTSGAISPRAGIELYGQLLREPTAFDRQTRPAESLAVDTTPRDGLFGQWFALAVAQRDAAKAFETAELARRHRFQSTLHLGGRLISLRFLIEAPVHLLTREQQEQRVRLLNERPELKQLSDDMQRVRQQIASQPLVATDGATQRRLDASYRELETLAARQEAMLHRMALEGVPVPNLFPPFVPYEEFRGRLPEGTVTLMYFETMGEIYGFLISRDKSEIWRIKSPQQLKTDVSKYLALIGQGGATSQLEIAELSRGAWAKAGQTLFLELLGGDRTLDFTELVIVPDGFLWYVPFETLSVDVGGKRRPLVALSGRTVRYAPTAGLGLPIERSRNAEVETLVLLGKMAASQDASAARNAVARMGGQEAGLKSVTPAQVTRSPALYAKFIPQLIVLADVAPPEQDHDWSPLFGAKDIPGTKFSDWLRLPWGGPRLVVLPCYHTAAEEAMRTGGDGHELFLPLTALMSCGAETIIISRWHPGGRTPCDQIGEFFKNGKDKNLTAAQAWQRASLEIAASKLMGGEEPRIKGSAADKAALDLRANHPFFWGALLFCDRGQEISPTSSPPATQASATSVSVAPVTAGM